MDPGDANLLDTALRETREEIGLAVPQQSVVGQLVPVSTLSSGFVIVPFVAVLDSVPALRANAEVDEILHIPLAPFLQTMAADADPAHGAPGDMRAFTYRGRTVWGASARILEQVHARVC